MFRGLISLLLLATMNAATISPTPPQDNFKEVDLLSVERVPTKKSDVIHPVIEAKAALVMDVDSGVILYEKNIYTPLPIASLTKIMTAIIILENHELDEVVTVQKNYSDVEGVKIWLYKGEKMTINNLLTALLVRSAGDVAMLLAEFHSGSVKVFVEKMNEKAQELGLYSTHFTNPIGLDDDGHFASAFDLAALTKYALRNENFRRFINITQTTITSTDGRIKHSFKNTNWLLNSYLDIRGVKTGTTDQAGASLINLAKGGRGQEIIAVVLNSPNRFQENKMLIDWTWRSFEW